MKLNKSKKTVCVLTAAACLLVSNAAGAFYEDVPDSAWYRDSIAEATAKGWFAGYSKRSFMPNGFTTRAQAAKVIYSHVYGDSLPSDDGFGYEDVDTSAWYEPYVNINIKYGLIPAYESYFEPDVYITRNDLTVALVRAMGLKTSDAGEAALYSYTDWRAVDEEYRPAVAAALENGILTGYEDGRLRMNAPVTRAQFTVFMSRVNAPGWENGLVDSGGEYCYTNLGVVSDYFQTPACTVTPPDKMTLSFAHYNERLELTYTSDEKSGETYLPPGIYRLTLKDAGGAAANAAAGKSVKFNYMPSVIDYDTPFRTTAHRGGSFGAPENTVSAFELAAKNGYSYIECDVRWTSDNVPVISHNASLGNPAAGFGAIAKTPLSKLREFRFSSYGGTSYADEPIATYEEMIGICKRKGLNPYVEIYDGESFTPERARQLIDIAKKYNMEFRITWISSYFDALKTIKEVSDLPDLRLLYVCSAQDYPLKWRLAELKNSTNRVGLDADYRCLDKDYTEFMKAAGFDVECWTVDDADTAARLMEMGVTGLTTNSLPRY